MDKSYSIIIQGEGKGHFSQAMVLLQQISNKKETTKGIYIGRSLFTRLPAYFREEITAPYHTFLSPNFLRTPDKKGIRIWFSLLLNGILSPIYLFEVIRLGIMLAADKSSHVINHYDPVGLLASSWFKSKCHKVVISHHFYLSHPDFIHPHGLERSYFWLQLMNFLMIRKSDEAIALSFRKGKSHKKIRVLPPLIDDKIMQGNHLGEGRGDLCYFLTPGYVEEALDYYERNTDFQADIFTNAKIERSVPANVTLHGFSREVFLSKLLSCSRIICTAGFDTVAEAFYLSIPVFVIPATNHYEQFCNAIDASRTGMAFQLEEISDLEDVVFMPRQNAKYIEWVRENMNHI